MNLEMEARGMEYILKILSSLGHQEEWDRQRGNAGGWEEISGRACEWWLGPGELWETWLFVRVFVRIGKVKLLAKGLNTQHQASLSTVITKHCSRRTSLDEVFLTLFGDEISAEATFWASLRTARLSALSQNNH